MQLQLTIQNETHCSFASINQGFSRSHFGITPFLPITFDLRDVGFVQFSALIFGNKPVRSLKVK